jgi:hypothetical protein
MLGSSKVASIVHMWVSSTIEFVGASGLIRLSVGVTGVLGATGVGGERGHDPLTIT